MHMSSIASKCVLMTHHKVEDLARNTTKAHENTLLVVQAHKEAVTVLVLHEQTSYHEHMRL